MSDKKSVIMWPIKIGGDSVGMIEDLYSNPTSFEEEFGYPYNNEQRIMGEDCEELRLRLYKLLTDEQKELLDDIFDLKVQMSSYELERMFVYGFKLGAKLIMDIQKWLCVLLHKVIFYSNFKNLYGSTSSTFAILKSVSRLMGL